MNAALTAAYTNLFRVKNVPEFLRHVDQFTGATVEVIEGQPHTVRMRADTPWLIFADDGQGNVTNDPVDLTEFVSPHLMDGEVAVFSWVSAERTSLLGGVIGVNSAGEAYSQTLSGLEAYATAVLGLNGDPTAILED